MWAINLKIPRYEYNETACKHTVRTTTEQERNLDLELCLVPLGNLMRCVVG